MRVAKKEIQRRVARFEQVCRQHGLKVTHQRTQIFRELAAAVDHPDVETLYKRVHRRVPAVSLDTVYRTLWMLMDMGLITTLGLHRDRVRFDGETGIHHHFICTKCGMARDLHGEELNNLKAPREVKSLGRVETTHVEFRGLCSKCLK